MVSDREATIRKLIDEAYGLERRVLIDLYRELKFANLFPPGATSARDQMDRDYPPEGTFELLRLPSGARAAGGTTGETIQANLEREDLPEAIRVALRSIFARLIAVGVAEPPGAVTIDELDATASTREDRSLDRQEDGTDLLASGLRAEYRKHAAGQINAWWANSLVERFWLEITDRPDIGVDLHAPQRDAAGRHSAGYSPIWWVEPQDTVFHYDLNERAITAYSRAAGEVTEAPVVWLSHRGATRRRLGSARAQPGWWLDLDGSYPLETPLTLASLRDRAELVRDLLETLEASHPRPLYFPFFFYGGGELRPMQPYLNKLPAALVARLPELSAAAGEAARAPLPIDRLGTPAKRRRTDRFGSGDGASFGAPYRRAQARNLPDEREPFSVDPSIVERGLSGHVDTQNAVADALTAASIMPRSRQQGEPNFDLGWERDGVIFVGEVKSMTNANEEKQLRLGLGQVLRYRSLLAQVHPKVRAVLITEREPLDVSWHELCRELGVLLVTPIDLTALIE
jgi:hypothetical protein